MSRQGFVLIPSWFEGDGYRPALVTEGRAGLERANFILEMELNEASDYLRSLNALRGLDQKTLERLVQAAEPSVAAECIVSGITRQN